MKPRDTLQTAALLLCALAPALGPGCDDGPGPRADAGPADANLDADELGEPDSAPQCAEEPGSVPDGADCVCTSDCLEGAVCVPEEELGNPSGDCSRLCEPGSDQCGEGATCLEVEGLEDVGLCARACAVDEDCEDDQVCGYGTCFSFCTSDDQCRSGRCNRYTGRCDQGEPPEGAGVDGECLRDEDCQSQDCDPDEGRCVTFCSTEHGGCPEEAHCVPSDWPLLGRCMAGCETSEECGEGHDCVQIADPLDARVCLPEGHAMECYGRTTVVTEAAPCGCNDDCSPGAFCASEMDSLVPWGMCIRPCQLDDPYVGPTGPGDECGTDFVCVYNIAVNPSDGGGACHPLCESTDDCPPGRICSATEGCVPFCQEDDECLFDLCDPYTGLCGLEPDPWGLWTGARCTDGEACRSDECRLDEAGENGFCSSRCSISAQRCPDGAVCVDDGEGDDLGYCAAACEGDEDCTTPGTRCAPESAPGLGRHCDFP